MNIEQMITEAVLIDRFSPVLRRIAAAQDEYARKTMALNTAANVSLGVGAGATAFLVQSVKVAGTIDQITKSLTAVEGANQAAFDVHYADQYATRSMQTYMKLENVANAMGLRHLSVSKYLQDAADIAAGARKPLEQVADLLMRIQSNQMGYPLGSRGLPRMGISTQQVFDAARIPYTPGQKIQGAITPEQALGAIHRVIGQMGWHGLDQKLARTTLQGSSSMVEDAISRIEKGVGSANLQPTIEALDHLADVLNKIATFTQAHPRVTFAIEGTAAIGLLAGGIMKGVVAWRNYQSIVGAVKKIADSEREGEIAKTAVAKDEAAAVSDGTYAFKYRSEAVAESATATEAASETVIEANYRDAESTAAVTEAVDTQTTALAQMTEAQIAAQRAMQATGESALMLRTEIDQCAQTAANGYQIWEDSTLILAKDTDLAAASMNGLTTAEVAAGEAAVVSESRFAKLGKTLGVVGGFLRGIGQAYLIFKSLDFFNQSADEKQFYALFQSLLGSIKGRIIRRCFCNIFASFNPC